MPRIEAIRSGAVVATRAGARASFGRSPNGAPFLSQLIAERNHLAPQRARRRAPMAEVLETYDAGGKVSERRLPPGYRMDVLV